MGLAGAGAGAGTTVTYLPSELDSSSNTGHQLHAAVAHFSHTLSSHLQLLANSAVQQEKRDKEAEAEEVRKRKKERDEKEEEPDRDSNDKGANKGLSRAFTFNRKKRDRDDKNAPLSPVPGEEAATAGVTGEEGQAKDAPAAAAEGARGSPEQPAPAGISGGSSALALSPEEIGDSGVIFLRRLVCTQAFSNYCYEKTSRGESRRVAEVRGQYRQQLAASCTGRIPGPIQGPLPREGRLLRE